MDKLIGMFFVVVVVVVCVCVCVWLSYVVAFMPEGRI